MSASTDRRAKIVQAAEELIGFWRHIGGSGSTWMHRGHWYPVGSERLAKKLINAVLTKEKKRGK